MVTPAAERDAVAHLQSQHGVSELRAYDVLQVDRSSVRYKSTRSDDVDLREAMKNMAAVRRRFGYRRIHVMLQRQGWHVNHKKIMRLYPVRRSCMYANVAAGNEHWARESLCFYRAV